MEVGEIVMIICLFGVVYLMFWCCCNSSERSKIVINLFSRVCDIDYGYFDKKIKKEKKVDIYNF